MGAPRSLPVILPTIAGQRWSCHSCGNCCRSLVVHLTKEERQRLDKQQWEKELGAAPYVRCGREWALNKREDGACVFLDENNRCLIHARFGEAAKPVACRIFPFSVRPLRDGWQASLRFDCPSTTSSKGQPIPQHKGWLRDLTQQLDYDKSVPKVVAELQRGVRATAEEIEMVISRFTRWLIEGDLPLDRRLIGAARVTQTLIQATLKNVRGSRFADLLDLLFKALPVQCETIPNPPTRRQHGMLRQLAFAHAEHVTLAERRTGLFTRLGKRWQQLGSAKRFLAGRGIVPQLPGTTSETTFEEVATISGPADDRAKDVTDLLRRYLAARLSGRTTFGRGYYGWSVVRGLTALWLSVAVVGWHARYLAALDRRSEFGFDDVAVAVGIVDRAATRLPALGTTAEKVRVIYLTEDDGVARLLQTYTPLRTSL